MKLIIILSIIFSLVNFSICKYVEGVLKTSENWVFLARFCFLSEYGQFEYVIDYNENQGDLNLLLYYDVDNQWPAVYKTNKTCEEKETVVNIQHNQIVKLTVDRNEHFSECQYLSDNNNNNNVITTTSPAPLYTINLPTPKNKKKIKGKDKTTTTSSTTSITDSTIFTSTLPQYEYELTTNLIESTTTAEILNSDITTTDNYNNYTTTNTQTNDYIDVITTSESQPTTTTITNPNILLNLSKRSIPIDNNKIKLKRKRMNRIISCHSSRRFRSARERWWFIAISNCNGSKGININYQLLMTNGPVGDYWHEHFSADEFYILPVLIIFSVVYGILFLAIIICSSKLKQRQLLHSTYKLFVLSCTFQLIGILLLSIVYLKMAVSGRESPRFKRFGNIQIGAAETCFLLVLLLLAKGYTVTRGRLSLNGTVKLTIFMCIYITTYVSIFIYEASVFDSGEVLYLYESPAGYALIILKLIAWGMFLCSTIATLKKYPEKSNFYYPFNLFGTIWFIAGPAFIISANNYIDKWVRESVVCAVLHFIAFSGHFMFLILTMPNVANKNFPYHVRTTQIGIMEMDCGKRSGTVGVGGGTLDQFGHHVYEPSSLSNINGTIGLRDKTIIIPLTKRTEEYCQNLYENQKKLSTTPDTTSTEQHHHNQHQPQYKDYTQEEIEQENRKMENIIKWSLGKNAIPTPKINVFDFLSFEQQFKNKEQEEEKPNGTINDNNATTNKTNETSTSNENRQHVPIELFTVSKSIDNNELSKKE